MRNKYQSFLFIILCVGLMLSLTGCNHVLLMQPKGVIAASEKNLILLSTLLMLLVVIPVIILTLVFAYKYRATNTNARYDPDWHHNKYLEIIWWAIPCVIIAILGTATWITSHTLDPFKPLDPKIKPITIQVIALDWKWLFIYPDQNIATVNFIEIPVNVPISFEITSDAPMNSFWIPQLGGQIYAMAGMQTRLHLMASTVGSYKGVSANFSGSGFSGMQFIAKATSAEEFKQWVTTVKQSPNLLNVDAYNKLAEPSEDNSVITYSPVENNLYNFEIMKYMMPNAQIQDSNSINMQM